MTMPLEIELYKDYFQCLNLGTKGGKPALSKPLFLLTMLEGIEQKIIKDNRIQFNHEWLNQTFKNKYTLFYRIPSSGYTGIYIRPFFHLGSEPFYELIWREKHVPPLKSHSPSAKYLRENLAYAKLDDDLWELLQDKETREYFRQLIIDTYLRPEK